MLRVGVHTERVRQVPPFTSRAVLASGLSNSDVLCAVAYCTPLTVERLFSKVGVAYSSKRKSAGVDTLAKIVFAQCNLP